MLYMALCGEYVLIEKFGYSGCCGGRESRLSFENFSIKDRILSPLVFGILCLVLDSKSHKYSICPTR